MSYRCRLAASLVGLFLLSEPFSAPWQFTRGLGAVLVAFGIMPSRGSWIATCGVAVFGWLTARYVESTASLLALTASALLLRYRADRSESTRVALVCASVLGILANLEGVPVGARGLAEADDISASVTQFCFGLPLSARAAGLHLLAAVSIACWSVALPVVVWVAACIALWCLRAPLGVHPHAAAPYAAALLAVFTIAAALVLRREARRPTRPPWRVALITLAAVACARAGAAMPRGHEARRVAVLNVGLQDHAVPQHGSYGAWSGGMFGLLREYVQALGFEYSLLGRSDLDGRLASRADTLFIVNINEPLSAPEVDALESFMADGGACVVLADHTNVAGLRGPTNAITEPHGISVRFDSAKNIGTWSRCWGTPSVNWLGRCDDDDYFPYGIGASLDVGAAAMPLLRARHAFSDRGYTTNYPGAFLGNYRLDAGERYGDLTVVAASPVGKGWLFVFGDTTPFQNAALPSSATRVLGCLLAQVHGGVAVTPPLILALGVAVAAAFVSLRGVSAWWLAALPAGASLVVAIVTLNPAKTPGRALDKPVAWEVSVQPIDGGTANQPYRGTWSVTRSLERAGWLCFRASDMTEDVLRSATLVSAVMPLARLPRQGDVVAWIRAGGHFFFCGGPTHARAVEDVLKAAGITIDSRARGPLPDRAGARSAIDSPFFPSTYSILLRGDPQACQVLAQAAGHVCAVRVTVGMGSVIVVADDAWPYGSYIEGENAWHIGNITFLDRLWRSIAPHVG